MTAAGRALFVTRKNRDPKARERQSQPINWDMTYRPLSDDEQQQQSLFCALVYLYGYQGAIDHLKAYKKKHK